MRWTICATALPSAGVAAYTASKTAVEQFTLVAARELAERAITVNTVSPGFTDTALFHNLGGPGATEASVAMTPLGRLGEPADIAAVVTFLVGPDARWRTGQHLRATGGVA